MALLPIMVIFQTKLLEWLTQMLDLSFLFSDVTTHFFFFLILTYMYFEKVGMVSDQVKCQPVRGLPRPPKKLPSHHPILFSS